MRDAMSMKIAYNDYSCFFSLDDNRIAPDFFEYFTATYSILHSDPTVWCVSALNENGRSDLIADNPGDYFLPSPYAQGNPVL